MNKKKNRYMMLYSSAAAQVGRLNFYVEFVPIFIQGLSQTDPLQDQ